MTCRAELAWTVGGTFRGFSVRCDVEDDDHVVHSAPLASPDGIRVRIPLSDQRLQRRRAQGRVVPVSGLYDPDDLTVRVTWRDPAAGPVLERRRQERVHG